jgi:hypothetical protein
MSDPYRTPGVPGNVVSVEQRQRRLINELYGLLLRDVSAWPAEQRRQLEERLTAVAQELRTIKLCG